jgi:hypothetical protein
MQSFIAQEGPLAYNYFDFYTQALAKLEWSHRKDLDDSFVHWS